MHWKVTYRTKSAECKELYIEAPDRHSLFKVLAEKEIKPIRVEKVIQSKGKLSFPSFNRTFVVLSVVIIPLVAAIITLLISKREVSIDLPAEPTNKHISKTQPQKVHAPKSEPIKEELKPLPIGQRRNIRGDIINVPKNPWGQRIPKELEYKPIWEYTPEDYAKVDPGYLARHEAHKKRQASIPWKTDADRQLSLLLFATDGNTGLLTPFNRRFKDQFLKSLETPIIPSKDDSPELQEQKRQMNEVKIFLKERMDAGEDIVEILNDEYKKSQKVRVLRQNLQEELRKLEKTATSVEEVQDYIDAANKMLDEHGASHLGLPLILTHRRLERESATQNQE